MTVAMMLTSRYQETSPYVHIRSTQHRFTFIVRAKFDLGVVATFTHVPLSDLGGMYYGARCVGYRPPGGWIPRPQSRRVGSVKL